jgi:multiple antibiotic resistance protein
MLTAAAYVKIFVALLVVVNPFGIIPIFVAMTAQQTETDRKRIARVAAVAVAVVLIVSALLGERILEIFGISLASFKVGGAILVMLNAIAMMQATQTRVKQTPEEAREAEDKVSIAVVPLAIPLLAGPGAISTMIIYAAESKAVLHLGVIAGCGMAVGLATWIALRIATRVGHLMSHTAINIATRLMGLLLAALAVEIFASGAYDLWMNMKLKDMVHAVP